MYDLPVIATSVAAYRFLARELATIVRLSWAALFIVAVIQYLVARGVLAEMASALADGDLMAAAASGHDPLWLTLKFGADIIGTAIVAVAIHQLILFDDRKEGRYVHIAFGIREALFLLLGTVLGAVVVLFATNVVSPFGEAKTGSAPFFAWLAFMIAIYLSIRLWPVLPMIVVAGRLDFPAAWRLTRHRFWSLLALVLLGSIPLGLMALAIDSALPSFDSLMDAISGPRQGMPSASAAAAAVARAQDWLVLRVLLDFAASVVATAVTVALISFSYLVLTGRPLDRPLPQTQR
ncbi:MAG: hypothetical protein ACJ8ES_14800 [Xanthobacteraceae bacterium]|jgi:hypothetical protein